MKKILDIAKKIYCAKIIMKQYKKKRCQLSLMLIKSHDNNFVSYE